ncbi:TonB-dependent receptor [Lysobacter sp. GX 14042]|uniref:TonB-dependent receptor plug domain-containing protein n=1 Tax=Lysobacter sp. GX 14042 TaxID=2907155 RepID=UPI001F3598E1|nr:TonB-dependent receptor [Lysobacter sp. GX 14042]MCE7032892.1 TonB-dependent receptor [Lysobacter sp. GX 14042]
MSNDKDFVVSGLGQEMRGHLEAAGRETAGGWRMRQKSFGSRGTRSGMARSLLAVAVAASLLPQHAALAQEPSSSVEARGADASAEATMVTEPDTTATELETIQVTGTRIKGGSVPSPLIAIGVEQIREEGFADLGEVIRSIPQNFSGGQNPGVAGGATAGAGGLANQNVTGGSSLNLRGAGPDATLTLLNGRRLSYGGFVQGVDISAIPVEAVERIEIVADGASAIYGSDAVGGVGNVILQRDYDGVRLGTRYGGATGGGADTREYTMTAGTTWQGGGVISTFKDVSVDPVFARQREYTRYMSDRSTLWPGSGLQSGLASAHQAIGGSVELRLDALKTKRNQTLYPYNTDALPYYNVLTPKSTVTLVSPVVEVALRNDWTLQLGGAVGEDRLVNRHARVDLGTGALTQMLNDCFCNEILTYDVGAEGPVFSLPGGDTRLAVGAGYRRNDFAQHNYLAGVSAVEGSEASRFAYAEINLPILGREPGSSGARLELSLAARKEDYDSFGSMTTPKAGLIYGPSPDFTIKGSWGRSFKAPTLFQRFWTRQTILDPATYYGGVGYPDDATVLSLGGGNPDLGAERATTWSASLAIHPEAIPGLEAELTWFDIDYTDRVVQPMANYSQSLGDPRYDRFITYSPTQEELEQALAQADLFYNRTGEPFDPGRVVAIRYGQFTNVARQRIHGLDVSASYRMDMGPGRLSLRGSASWLDSSQQPSPAEDAYDLAGMLYSPAEVNGRVGAVWSQGGFSASGFLNYTSGVTNALVPGRTEKTSSFTTLDATLLYATGPGEGAWSDVEVSLAAQNLLDRDPPFHTPSALDHPPYDSTNYSGMGRFVSVSISKHF